MTRDRDVTVQYSVDDKATAGLERISGKLKRYISHVTLIRDDCPHELEDLDSWDWDDERRAVLDTYTRDCTLSFTCAKGGRDAALKISIDALLVENPEYKVARTTVPAFDGFEDAPVKETS